jgi:MFS family permease
MNMTTGWPWRARRVQAGAAGEVGNPGTGRGERAGARRRWVILATGMAAMTAGCTFQYGLAYMIPALRREGLSLEEAGLLVACPTAGLLLTLVVWGAAADRWGERLVLGAGLSLAGAVLLAGAAAGTTEKLGVCLALAGAAGASVYAASGRLILGWFAGHERGLAMGIRQSAQPLGVAIAGLVLPSLAGHGRSAALLFLGAFCLAAAALVALTVRDPPRPEHERADRRSPYREPMLWRIHAASSLLVVPQFTVATFALVFLVDAHGWHAPAAGRVLAVAALCGAAVLAVSTNGLAFTAVAERAGSSWAGRALGIQNTAQNAFAAATPPVIAAVIGRAGYPAVFAVVAAFPLLAASLVPVAAERAAGLVGGGRS